MRHKWEIAYSKTRFGDRNNPYMRCVKCGLDGIRENYVRHGGFGSCHGEEPILERLEREEFHRKHVDPFVGKKGGEKLNDW